MFLFAKRKCDFDILIIDDEKDFLASMESWFISHGYSVVAVSTSAEAIGVLKKKMPKVIFLDAVLGQEDNIDTLWQIRQLRPQAPVVMLTSSISEEARLNAYKLGVNAFFEKTLDFYRAEDLINSFVRVALKRKC